MQERCVAASIAPSLLVPSLNGLITNRTLRKNRPIFCDGCGTLDLLRMPMSSISLSRFIALRHQWVSDEFFTLQLHDVDQHMYRLLLPATVAPSLAANDATSSTRSAAESRVTKILKGKKMFDKLNSLQIDDFHLEPGHVFQINDAFPWVLPPADDLASPAYWKEFKKQMLEYQKFARGDCCNVELRYEQKVDDSWTLCLVTQKDISEGNELLLHYGREWWTTVILRTVFMAAADEQLKDIRWIESLFASSEDRPDPFPYIVPKALEGRDTAGNRTVLFDMATRQRATNAAALAFAVRRSCKSDDFLQRLMMEVFENVEAEVPIKALRRALLRDLLGEEPIKIPSPDPE